MTRRIVAFSVISVLASAGLAALYARGGAAWVLGFVFLVPWLRTLDTDSALGPTLLRAYAMSVAYTAAAFAWLGVALGQYVQVGAITGVALLLLAAPMFQPQFFAFALARHLTRRRHGVLLGALAGAAAWVATEWLVPRLLGDTLGYGLYPSRLLRQGAEVGGAAGLTVLLLLTNEALTAALARRAGGWRAAAKPLACAALIPLLLAAYGQAVLPRAPGAAERPVRFALIQANLVDYEHQRQEQGAHAVVRQVLDTYFAMSYDAVVRQHADAVLWPETAYPTTFGHPKSAAGAAFDTQILDTIKAAGVPFIFGTYDRDSAGEYNAAAFVMPDTGLLGFYRKTRLFPLTEYVPAWLDGPALRAALPWSGTWRAGNGARVFPIKLRDGREIAALPMICLDDVDASLAINGARLGAQVILTMSNDSWFSATPLGAQLHQSVAAFRSIETRLPQYRVTTNGYSAVIDASGAVLAGARMGEASLVVVDITPGTPARTLMVIWGEWVGFAASVFLVLLGGWSVLPKGQPGLTQAGAAAADKWPVRVALLSPAARIAAGSLRLLARGGLLWMGAALLLNEALRTNTLAQIRMFSLWCVAPEAAAYGIMLLFSAQASIADGMLVLARGKQRLAVALTGIVQVRLWNWPLPSAGCSLTFTSGQCWHLALSDPAPFTAALGIKTAAPRASMQAYLQAGMASRRSCFDSALAKYVLLPLVLVIPAFHLQQQIAYGGALGEYYTFGLKAYLSAFTIWWAAWTIGVVLTAALLRAAIELATLTMAVVQPGCAVGIRQRLEWIGHAGLFVGMPVWLALTVYAR